jgi:WD40 repeat protein
MWDLNTAKLNILAGHSSFIYSVAKTSDNSKISSGGGDNTFKVWDLYQGKCYLSDKFDALISSIASSKSRNLIALGDSTG